MPITVTLNDQIRQCDHCGAKNIKRTFAINIKKGETYYVGRICISKMVGIDTSGNPHHAALRIENYLRSLELDEVMDILQFDE